VSALASLRRLRAALAWPVLLVTLALCSCRAPAASDDFLPLVPGASWAYEVRSSLGRTELEAEAIGETRLPGRDDPFFLVREKRRREGGTEVMLAVGYVVEDDYIAQLMGLGYDDEGTLRLLGQDTPLRILPLRPSVGQRWNQAVRVFTSAGDPGGLTLWESEVRASEPVSVPAGDFADVIVVETTYRTEDGPVVMSYRDVYARGVGLVHSLAFDPAAPNDRRVEQRLLRYELP